MSKRDPKTLILDAALACFVDNGFEPTTVGAIIARAGISNGALFHHFASKDAIAEALYLRGIASYQEGLVAALERTQGADHARAAVRAAIHHHLGWVEDHRDLARFMYERGRPDWQPAQGAAVRKLNRTAASHVHDWIAPLVAAGVVRKLPMTVIAACVTGPAHFVARRWLSGLITARPRTFTDALTDAAWAALAPGRPRRVADVQRPSPTALIETAARDAAIAACSGTSTDDWHIAQLTMTSLSQASTALLVDAHAAAVRPQGDGSVVLIEIDVVSADGDVACRGQVVCVRATRAPEVRVRVGVADV
jgi:AcrR family transcriptional regulator